MPRLLREAYGARCLPGHPSFVQAVRVRRPDAVGAAVQVWGRGKCPLPCVLCRPLLAPGAGGRL